VHPSTSSDQKLAHRLSTLDLGATKIIALIRSFVAIRTECSGASFAAAGWLTRMPGAATTRFSVSSLIARALARGFHRAGPPSTA
jgi:hypothetical protein